MNEDLISLHEWNQFADERKTLLEALTILNNRHREAVSKLERHRLLRRQRRGRVAEHEGRD